MSWTLAARAAKMNPSVIREILKVTEQPGIISFAGGLPSAQTFPVAEFAAACAKVLQSDAPAALPPAKATAPCERSWPPIWPATAQRLACPGPWTRRRC